MCGGGGGGGEVEGDRRRGEVECTFLFINLLIFS